MKTTRIFRMVWRINSLLILATGLMACGVLLLVIYGLVKDIFRTREVSEMVNVEPSAEISSEWALGSFEPVAGTDYLMAPAFSQQSYQVSYYDKDASAVRNYLFVNAVDQTGRWLVPSHGYLFLTAEALLQPDANPKDDVVKWMKYEVAKSDTNGDGRLTAEDQRAIAISSAAGEGYVEVIQKLDQTLGSRLQDQDTLLLFYRIGKKNFVSVIKLPERQVTITKELPPIQPQ